MKCIRKLAVLVTVVAASASLLGQSAPDIENGFKPYGSYDGSNIDSVNLMNGNLMLHIPMPFSYPQRGGKINPKNILTVSSKQWNVQCVTTPNNTQVCSWVYGGQPPSQLMPPAPFGVGFDYTMDIALYRTTVTDTTSSGISSYTGFDYYLASEDGSTHQVVPSPNAALDGNGDPMSFDAVDTSGLHVDLSSPDKVTGIPSVATIIDRQGNRYQTSTIGGTCHSSGGQNGSDTIRTCSQRGSVATITDSNGNVYNASTQSPLDTMGRTFTSFTGATGGDTSKCVTNGLPLTPNPYPATTYTYAGPNGTSNQFTVCYASLTVQTSFGLSGVNEAQNGYGVVSPLTATVPVTVIMPDGGKWVFQYDSYADIT